MIQQNSNGSMEKNQHNQNRTPVRESEQTQFTGDQPGQQLPAGTNLDENKEGKGPAAKEVHSEESFPQNDNETLGTP
jgi:hypothetical protein